MSEKISVSYPDDLVELAKTLLGSTREFQGWSHLQQVALRELLESRGVVNSEAREKEILNIVRGLEEEGIDTLAILSEAGGKKLEEVAS